MQHATRREMKAANHAEHAEARAAAEAAAAAAVEERRLLAQIKRDANRAANLARYAGEREMQERRLKARWLLRDLPVPDRAVSQRWLRMSGTRHEVGLVIFETERALRTLDRAVDETMRHRSDGPEIAAALTLMIAPVLRSLPFLAQVVGGELVEPLARVTAALEAEPEVLAQAMYDDHFADDTEEVRQLLRTGQPVVLDPASAS